MQGGRYWDLYVGGERGRLGQGRRALSREDAWMRSQGRAGWVIDEITMTEAPWGVNGGEGHE